MATPDELLIAIKVGREALGRAIEAAGSNWETTPSSGEGEGAWSARQTAEHVISAELYFAGETCKACGYDPPESPFPGPLQLATAADGSAALDLAVEAASSKQKYVSAEDLAKTHEGMGTVEGVMTIQVGHLINHAMQIQAAASS